MSDRWERFFDKSTVEFKLDTEIHDRLKNYLEKVNKGRRKGKLRLDDLISHWLIELGDATPKIEKVIVEPKDITIDLYGPSAEALELAASANEVSKEEVLKFLLSKYEAEEPIIQRKRKRNAAVNSISGSLKSQ